ncbi:hypothetical protein [Amycolatopsis sp. NPDC004378]
MELLHQVEAEARTSLARSVQQSYFGIESGLWVREEALIAKLSEFLSSQIFGAYRRSLLWHRTRELGESKAKERAQRIATILREIEATELKSKRALRNLELFDKPDEALIRDVNDRRAELHQATARSSAGRSGSGQPAGSQPRPAPATTRRRDRPGTSPKTSRAGSSKHYGSNCTTTGTPTG